ncbi:hypothetical protein PSI15_10190 [Xenorhabdus sp. PR6a]|uniref:hypothetical protein n=1 Tax=Xenorhabdus sp. PR6a TaxID=3025877 RepID=UPI002359ECE4|nr:hypothetical protein [Xenorhabdus sp. PR6a]MDC9581930.1 hypothetical protein [Xenorhabdus sp. PR6a]
MSDEAMNHDDCPNAEEELIDLRDEIDRKTLASIENILIKLEKRFITRNEAKVAIYAVFDAVQGLVNSDVGEVLNAALTEIQKNDKADQFPMVFAHKGAVVVLKLDMFSRTVTYMIVKADGTKMEKSEVLDDEPAALKSAITKAITFTKNGAVKL